MLRRLGSYVPAVALQQQQQPLQQTRHYNTTYGVAMRSHQGVVASFFPSTDAAAVSTLACKDGEEFITRALPILDALEERLAQWRLAKWEFRIPASVRPEERETAKRQLALIRGLVLDRMQQREAELKDLAVIADATKSTPAAVRFQTRAWMQEKVTSLRWKGDVATARQLREAWVRLEQRGGAHSNILERITYIYSLARLGTFDTAFGNTIVPLGSSSASSPAAVSVGKGQSTSRLFPSLQRGATPAVATIDHANPMQQLLQLVLVNVPSVSILHDFLGLNAGTVVDGYGAGPGGYRDALGFFVTQSIREQLKASGTLSGKSATAAAADPGASGDDYVITKEGHRVPRAFASVADAVPTTAPNSLLRVSGRNKAGDRIAVFDYRVASNTPRFPAPPCDFAVFRGTDVTLLTIASPNRHFREAQALSARQAEGIARRTAMLLGKDMSRGQVRTLLLPPSYVDKDNLRRLVRYLHIDGDALEGDISAAPSDCRGWVEHYDKTLSQADVDYAAQAKRVNEEEWFRL